VSATGTEVQGLSRVRVGKARRRALAAIAAFGVFAALPMAVEAAGGPVARGAKVVPTKDTPAAIKAALASDSPVVVAFLLPGITEDEIVQKRLNTLQRSGSARDTKFIVYRITGKTKLGDLPSMFEIKYTPAVAVIRSDDKLSNVWRGMVDEDIIAQSLIDARNAVPKPKPSDPAGLALAKKVNAAYVKVPGVHQEIKAPGTTSVSDMLLDKGLVVSATGTVTSGGKASEIIGDRTGTFIRVEGAKCWTPGPKDANPSLSPIETKNVQFSKPVTKGATILLAARDPRPLYAGKPTEFTIDAKTFQLVQERFGKTTVTYKTLAKAPVVGKPDKVC
jgi:hypothetical protein